MTRPPIRVLDVIQRLSPGGAGRALIADAIHCARLDAVRHEVLSLLPPEPHAARLAAQAGVAVHGAGDAPGVAAALARADIVRIHFWNAPEIHALLAGALPPARILLRCLTNGAHPPHAIPPQAAARADALAVSAASTLALPALRDAAAEPVLIPCGSDFARIEALARAPRAGFTVGYVGTVDFAKLHPDFVAMSAALDVADARFVVHGPGRAHAALARQAQARGDARFAFHGPVENVAAVLAQLDVFGYPLCPENYGTSELSLQEAMYAGVPPVVLPHGGAAEIVTHRETGLVAADPRDYAAAIAFLHRNRDEAARLGRNAAAAARARHGADRSAAAFVALYRAMMDRPKTPRRAAPGGNAGAALLVRSLGPFAAEFRASLEGDPAERVAAAEAGIAGAAPGLGDVVLEYRAAWPADPHLALWAGLVLAGRGRPALAAAAFHRAIAGGLDDARTQRHLAGAAGAAGSPAIAARAQAAARAAAAHG